MLYNVVKWIARLTINSYFRKITILGKDNILARGPIIFVANHPSAFMDPMVVAFSMTRQLHFLAAAEFFGKGLKSWFYRKQLNMIPVYRPTTLPNEAHKNDEVFEECIKLLASGGSILIFPEGNSVTEKRIRKLKTGVARMALGTRDHAKHGQVKIIPVGLNYSNPHRFQSELFINIGPAISIDQYEYSKEGVNALTDEIEKKLKETVHHVPLEELDSIVKKMELILKGKFKSNPIKDGFDFQQKVIDAMDILRKESPTIIFTFESKLDSYLNKIRSLGISDRTIDGLSIIVSFGEIARLIFALPVFLFGYLVNCIPYYLTVTIFRKLNLFDRDDGSGTKENVRSAFFGSIAMAIGMVMFLIYYISLSIGLSVLVGNIWLSLVLWIFFYLAGLVTLQYIHWVYLFSQRVKLRKLISKERDVFASLVIERQAIVEEILNVVN